MTTESELRAALEAVRDSSRIPHHKACSGDDDCQCAKRSVIAHLESALAAPPAPAPDAAGLREALEALRQEHLRVYGDCWYSCPKTKGIESQDGGYCGPDDDACTCGAEEHNAKLDAILASLTAAATPSPLAEAERRLLDATYKMNQANAALSAFYKKIENGGDRTDEESDALYASHENACDKWASAEQEYVAALRAQSEPEQP